MAEGEEVPDDGEPEPLAPLLPADPPLAEPVLPAGGGMDGVVQAASQSVAASPTMYLRLRGLSMFNRLPGDDWKYSARAGSDCLPHPASARRGPLC